MPRSATSMSPPSGSGPAGRCDRQDLSQVPDIEVVQSGPSRGCFSSQPSRLEPPSPASLGGTTRLHVPGALTFSPAPTQTKPVGHRTPLEPPQGRPVASPLPQPTARITPRSANKPVPGFTQRFSVLRPTAARTRLSALGSGRRRSSFVIRCRRAPTTPSRSTRDSRTMSRRRRPGESNRRSRIRRRQPEHASCKLIGGGRGPWRRRLWRAEQRIHGGCDLRFSSQ
jgi:hypothetical protein